MGVMEPRDHSVGYIPVERMILKRQVIIGSRAVEEFFMYSLIIISSPGALFVLSLSTADSTSFSVISPLSVSLLSDGSMFKRFGDGLLSAAQLARKCSKRMSGSALIFDCFLLFALIYS